MPTRNEGEAPSEKAGVQKAKGKLLREFEQALEQMKESEYVDASLLAVREAKQKDVASEGIKFPVVFASFEADKEGIKEFLWGFLVAFEDRKNHVAEAMAEGEDMLLMFYRDEG